MPLKHLGSFARPSVQLAMTASVIGCLPILAFGLLLLYSYYHPGFIWSPLKSQPTLLRLAYLFYLVYSMYHGHMVTLRITCNLVLLKQTHLFYLVYSMQFVHMVYLNYVLIRLVMDVNGYPQNYTQPNLNKPCLYISIQRVVYSYRLPLELHLAQS